MFISEKEDEETFRMEISGLLNEMGKYSWKTSSHLFLSWQIIIILDSSLVI